MNDNVYALREVLNRAAVALGSADALRWLDGPIAAFGGLTPRRLVAEGFTAPVLRYLSTMTDEDPAACRQARS